MAASKAKVQTLFKTLEKVVTDKLSADNAVIALNIFIQLTRILYYRQKRLGKETLKRKMVKQAWDLLTHHHEKCFQFRSEGQLAENMGDITEGDAVAYFGTYVVGTLKDALSQTITIGDGALIHLYKDGSGGHTMEPQFYQVTRGKRLPWIRHILANSTSIYLSSEAMPSGERRLIYTARAIVPLKQGESISYFVIIVRRDRNGNLHFLTAFPVFEEVEFLEIIESTSPYLK